MAIIEVSNQSALNSALWSVQSGDTIVLQDGYYGDLSLTRIFPDDITIQSASSGGATLGQLSISGSNIRIDDVVIDGSVNAGGSNIAITNSDINGFVLFRNTNGLEFSGNHVSGSEHGLFLESVKNFEVTGNVIEKVTADLMRVDGDSFNGLIENNVLWDMMPTKNADGTYIHADALQMFGRDSGTPHDIVIRGNYIYDDPNTGDSGNLWGQGIFLGGPSGGYKNIIIEENIVDTGSPHGISLYIGTEGNIISNNTILGSGKISVNGGDSSGTVVHNNVAKVVAVEDGAQSYNNFIYSDAQKSALFSNGGDGSTWQGFLPVEGSPIDFGSGYGALQRLEQLLGLITAEK